METGTCHGDSCLVKNQQVKKNTQIHHTVTLVLSTSLCVCACSLVCSDTFQRISYSICAQAQAAFIAEQEFGAELISPSPSAQSFCTSAPFLEPVTVVVHFFPLWTHNLSNSIFYHKNRTAGVRSEKNRDSF